MFYSYSDEYVTWYLDSTEILIEPAASAARLWYANTAKRPVLLCHFGRGNRQPAATAPRMRVNHRILIA